LYSTTPVVESTQYRVADVALVLDQVIYPVDGETRLADGPAMLNDVEAEAVTPIGFTAVSVQVTVPGPHAGEPGRVKPVAPAPVAAL
jgi:hypothetical protein